MLCSCECATGESLRPSTITGVYGDEVPPVLIPNTEVKLISADGTWLDTARESMSTPVSKTKSSHNSVGFLFYKYSERTIRKRNGEMSDAAIVPVERGAAERLAFTCCVKERPRASRRLRRRAAQTKKSADRDASTPGFQNKSTQHQLGAFALCPVTNTVGFITRYCARSVDFILPSDDDSICRVRSDNTERNRRVLRRFCRRLRCGQGNICKSVGKWLI